MINWSAPWNTLWLDDGKRPRTLVPHHEKSKSQDFARAPMSEMDLVQDAWRSCQSWGAKHGYRFALIAARSDGAVDLSGRCAGWRFDVHVLSHRAIGSVLVVRDDIELDIRPEPGPGSDVFEMVGRGFLPTRFLEIAWDEKIKTVVHAPGHPDFLDIDINQLRAWEWELTHTGCALALTYGDNPKAQSAHDIEFHTDHEQGWYWSLACAKEDRPVASWKNKYGVVVPLHAQQNHT